jgi:hypothetical protein
MSTRSRTIIFLGSRTRPVRRADNVTAICEPIVYTVLDPRHLTSLQASSACYGDSFYNVELQLRIHLRCVSLNACGHKQNRTLPWQQDCALQYLSPDGLFHGTTGSVGSLQRPRVCRCPGPSRPAWCLAAEGTETMKSPWQRHHQRDGNQTTRPELSLNALHFSVVLR